MTKLTKIPTARYIKDIKNVVPISEEVMTKGLIGNFDIKESKKGDYALFDLRDRTGLIKCKIWSDSLNKDINKEAIEFFKNFKEDKPCVIAVAGNKSEYEGAYIDVKAIKLRPQDKPIDYVQSSEIDEEGMFTYIIDYAKSIKEPFSTILIKKLTENKEDFISAPAAKKFHDNFGSGLIEHTFKMLKCFIGVKDLYPLINRDVMIFLIIQHDFEKINGYTLLPTIEWTQQEELVGHIVMGAISVYNELKEYGADDTTILAILNAMIAHHGQPDWGSAKPAITPEAKLLRDLDKMISDASRVEQTLKEKNYEEGKLSSDLFYCKY